MPKIDLAVRGGTIVTASDSYRADIGIRVGRVVTIGDRIKGVAKEIDAGGPLVLPGGVDAHIHFAQPTSDNTVSQAF